MTKVRVALIYDGLSIPPKDGVTYRAYNLIKSLRSTADIDIKVYLTDRGWITPEAIEGDGISATLLPADWLFKKPAQVAARLMSDGVDIIHVLNSHSLLPFYGIALAQMCNAKLICDMHDVDYRLYQSLNKSAEIIEESRRLQRHVGELCDHIFVMSADDMVEISSLVEGKSKLSYSPNGVYIHSGDTHKRKKQVVFLGNMTYEPNEQAALIIKEQIAPAIHALHPDVEFILVGRNSTRLCLNAPDYVKFVGEQDDISTYLGTSLLGIAPLLSGSGMKVKMLVYGAHQLPVLCTPVAAMGYNTNPGFIVAEDIPAFMKQLDFLLKEPDMLMKLGTQALTYVRNNFSWHKICCDISEKYLEVGRSKTPRVKVDVIYTPDGVKIDSSHYSMPMFMSEDRFKEYNPYCSEFYKTRVST